MFSEHRILRQNIGDQPKIEIAWDAIQQAGDDLMTKSGEVEHGYVLAGSMVPDGQGGVIARVTRVLSLGAGTAGTFDVSPKLAHDIENHPYALSEKFMGLAHSHRNTHPAHPSSQDLEYARRLTNQRVRRVCMVIKLHEDKDGYRDGGAEISVFNGEGCVDYAIVGNGNRQEFKAETTGRIDPTALRSPVRPQKPEKIHSQTALAA